MKTVNGIAGAPRRPHERSFKAEWVEQCLLPGASVAAVASAGGVNANLLFKWRRDHLRSKRPGGVSISQTVLVAVEIAPGVYRDAGNSQPLIPSPASSPMAVLAIGHGVSNRSALVRFAGNGRIESENDAAERALRAMAIRRKNFLHLGSGAGGDSASVPARRCAGKMGSCASS